MQDQTRTRLARCLPISWTGLRMEEDTKVSRRLSIALMLVGAVMALSGCSTASEVANENGNANANANVAAQATSRPAPDDSEITTSVDANGVRTETRVFRNNPRIARVVVTTKDGTRTVKAYSPSGEEREVNKNEPEDVLEATGSKIADAAGFVADKTKDVAGGVKEGGEKVGEKTVDTAKTVGNKTVDTAKTVGEKTAEGTKTVTKKTVSGAKKVGSAVKKIIP